MADEDRKDFRIQFRVSELEKKLIRKAGGEKYTTWVRNAVIEMAKRELAAKKR